MATYGGIAAGFQAINQRLDLVNQRLEFMFASNENTRIIARNRANGVTLEHRPLYKTVEGHGLVQATEIFGHLQNEQLQNVLQVPNPIPQVGSMPQFFNANYNNYTRADIVRLVIFYNDSFGIVHGDTLAQCISKFDRFLVTY
ncbi:hypothetical protein EI94DRAFT_1561825 [Lactarius quietus]|nr:hypothetical protein EI94DRAFT_1561825 [Lactarius quietus]